MCVCFLLSFAHGDRINRIVTKRKAQKTTGKFKPYMTEHLQDYMIHLAFFVVVVGRVERMMALMLQRGHGATETHA